MMFAAAAGAAPGCSHLLPDLIACRGKYAVKMCILFALPGLRFTLCWLLRRF